MLNLSNIILLICVSCMFSCKTVLLSDLKPENPIINLLPSLEPKVDIASLQSAYSLGSTKSRGSIVGYGTQSLGGIISTGSFYGQSTSFADKRIQDAVVLFEREIRNNISDGSNEPIGSVVCKIISGETRKSGLGWSALSLVTSFIYNIFGMPFFSYTTELEIEVEIRDCKNIPFARLIGYGNQKIRVAAWRGYSGNLFGQITGNESAARKSNIDAVKMAFSEIKGKISKSSEKIKKRLLSCRN